MKGEKMKRYPIYLFISLLVISCARKPFPEKAVLVKINDYEITKAEFEKEFKASGFGRLDDVASRRAFLDNLINRKLILQDAQKQGLDKDTDFLKLIEKFWEQSLLKLALDRKTRQIAKSLAMGEEEVRQAYEKMAQEGKADKPWEDMRSQIAQEISKAKEAQEMDRWIEGLRRDAQIKIDDSLLNN
jgi:hypothetical protein